MGSIGSRRTSLETAPNVRPRTRSRSVACGMADDDDHRPSAGEMIGGQLEEFAGDEVKGT